LSPLPDQVSPPKDRHLVWSVVPVLLAIHVPPQLIWSSLGINSPPGRDVVLRHLKNLTVGDEAARGDGHGEGGGTVLDRWGVEAVSQDVFARPEGVDCRGLRRSRCECQGRLEDGVVARHSLSARSGD
jgi:hypothetical protein